MATAGTCAGTALIWAGLLCIWAGPDVCPDDAEALAVFFVDAGHTRRDKISWSYALPTGAAGPRSADACMPGDTANAMVGTRVMARAVAAAPDGVIGLVA